MKIRALQLVGHKNTRPAALCVGAVPSLFGPSGADRRKAQDGCQNGQLWLGGPLRTVGHDLSGPCDMVWRTAACGLRPAARQDPNSNHEP